MPIEDIFSIDCQGTVFEPPCPTSFVSENRIRGNLKVTGDSFGGGFLNVSGNAPSGRKYEMTLDESVRCLPTQPVDACLPSPRPALAAPPPADRRRPPHGQASA
jgi:hypothetical protein